MSDEERRRALGDFLKARRAQLSPSNVGLPERGASRRTPGLRREEVAQLAGVSVSWYTWLEQGRDIRASEQVLESIAAALMLSLEERNHVFRLAHKRLPPRPEPKHTVCRALQTVLDNLPTSPAWILERSWNILVWNRAAREVFVDFGAVPMGECNILRLAFTDEELRQRLVDWEAFARSMLAAFRASGEEFAGEPWFVRLVEDLKRVSPEFREWWPEHDVREAPVERVRLNHPSVGLLELDNVSLRVNGDPELRVCIYAAAPETGTTDKIEQLINSAAADQRAAS